MNQILDTIGEFCDVGQDGPVWFLAGTFGGEVTRTCTVPRGKELLVAMLNQMLNAPEDIPYSELIATRLGLEPSTMSVEEGHRPPSLKPGDRSIYGSESTRYN